MAWGYWSATAVDRGRSPRRNTQQQQYPYQNQNYQQYSLAQSQHQQSTQCLNSCPQVAEPPPPVPPQQQPLPQPQLQQQPLQQQQQQPQQQVCSSPCHSPCHSPQFIEQIPPDLPCTPICTYSRRQSLDSPQANQLTDIICRAAQPSIQSAGNTLTRGTSLRDTGDYAVPHPHPHTHHYMTTSDTPRTLSRVGSCPGSTGGSGSAHGSGSGSSPGGGPGSGGGGGGRDSIIGSSMGICGVGLLAGSQGAGLEYVECSHYDRMPLPIPVKIPMVPPPQLHSEDEIEPAYATGLSSSILPQVVKSDKMKRSGRGRTEYYIKRHGLKAEHYHVTTDDGYQLKIFRLLPKLVPRGVVLLQHGIRQSSANWLALNWNLPMQLLDEGIEVWLANTRASSEGSTHISLSSSSAEFWDFSFHEFGYFDLPAIVDTILVISRWKRIHLIAFSQGAAAALIFLTKRPLYNEMIASLNLLAPAVIMANSRWTLLALLYVTFRPILPWSLQKFVTGSDERYGNSERELHHFQTLMLSGRFLMYNYGPKANMELYGCPEPPEYPLGKVTCPVTLHYGSTDRTVHQKDVKHLSTLFPGSPSVDMVRYKRMDHLDFIIRQEAATKVYPSVVAAVVKRL